jgi:short chain dehydrogenase
MMQVSRLFITWVFAAVVGSHAFVQKGLSGVRRSSSSSMTMLADDPKVILVTGSSRGLGRSIALDIGSHGHKMVINYVSDSSKESAEATVEEIKAAGGDAVAIQADCEYTQCVGWRVMPLPHPRAAVGALEAKLLLCDVETILVAFVWS